MSLTTTFFSLAGVFLGFLGVAVFFGLFVFFPLAVVFGFDFLDVFFPFDLCTFRVLRLARVYFLLWDVFTVRQNCDAFFLLIPFFSACSSDFACSMNCCEGEAISNFMGFEGCKFTDVDASSIGTMNDPWLPESEPPICFIRPPLWLMKGFWCPFAMLS